MPALFVDAPFTHLYPARGQSSPRPGIGFVVLISHNNRVACLQHLPKGLREHIGVLRGGGPKAHFIICNAHKPRQTRPRLVHFLPA